MLVLGAWKIKALVEELDTEELGETICLEFYRSIEANFARTMAQKLMRMILISIVKNELIGHGESED
jgi:hypothetical protein